MQDILNLFPKISSEQIQQFEALIPLYKELNAKVNVISRKDIDNLASRHILHSLFIDFVQPFNAGSEILDLGTGGGFPGIPLGILYPEVQFHLVDGTRKKIGVVEEIVSQLSLKNVTYKHTRAEEIKGRKFDFVVCRAVASVDKLLNWSRPLLKKEHKHGTPNGLYTWKGGNPKKETSLIPKYEYSEVYPLLKYTNDEYFEEKFILYVQG